MTAVQQDSQFIDAWNDLERGQRTHLRRLVRVGRVDDDPQLARLAQGYAKYQLARPWIRYFWLWFVPGLVIALGFAVQLHPIVIGVVIALAAQAVWARINIARLARTGDLAD